MQNLFRLDEIQRHHIVELLLYEQIRIDNIVSSEKEVVRPTDCNAECLSSNPRALTNYF